MGKQTWSILPENFLSRIKQIIPNENLEVALESFCTKRLSTFRANTLKITPEKLMKELTAIGIHFEQIPWYCDAFILTQEPQRTLMDTDLYKNGAIYLQSLSSMIPPLILDPQKDEIIGDLAAAPGSKTTQMAAIMKNSGTIIANDKSRIRLYKLEANLKLLGVANTTVTNIAGQIFWERYPEYFDKTLVDVPCSMEGRFFTDDPKSYAEWSTKKIKLLVQIQRFLLKSAVSATKSGGTIIYSTCTLAPEENEGIIDWILSKENNTILIEKIELDVPGKIPGLTHWNTKEYHPSVKETIRILPSKTMEGFFIAKLKKIKPTLPQRYVHYEQNT